MQRYFGYFSAMALCFANALLTSNKELMHDWLTAAFVGYVMWPGQWGKDKFGK